jgi:hypothetical protein
LLVMASMVATITGWQRILQGRNRWVLYLPWLLLPPSGGKGAILNLSYKFCQSRGKIFCTPNQEYCRYQLCDCNKTTAYYFSRNKRTYDKKYQFYPNLWCCGKKHHCWVAHPPEAFPCYAESLPMPSLPTPQFLGN